MQGAVVVASCRKSSGTGLTLGLVTPPSPVTHGAAKPPPVAGVPDRCRVCVSHPAKHANELPMNTESVREALSRPLPTLPATPSAPAALTILRSLHFMAVRVPCLAV